jgi:hypothetical protein
MTFKRCGTITSYHTLIRPGYCPECLRDESLPAAKRLTSWARDHFLWKHILRKHINEHAGDMVWPAACRHLVCDDVIADEDAHWQHLVDNYGLCRSSPDAVSSRKRKSLDGPEILTWISEHGPPPSRRKINPRMPSKPTPAGYRVDETGCLLNMNSDETSLKGCTTGVVDVPQLKTTDTCSADGSLLSPEFLRSPSPSQMSTGEFGGFSSDTAIDLGSDAAVLTLTAKPPSSALDPDAVRVARSRQANVIDCGSTA